VADDVNGPTEETEDLGEPIDELRELAEPPSAGFLDRLRRSLQRRSLSSQLASLGWSGLGAVLVEFLRMIYALFEDKPTDRGGSR
jgi:hypothetical protein